MIYPEPPWTLKGYGFATLHLLDIAKVRTSIPGDLEIVSVVPGKTLGGLAFGKYEAGSTLVYSELIAIAALVRHHKTLGSWISHIYVDQEQSIAGGREIWGLPKEYAEFHWQSHEQGGVLVKQDERSLCNFQCGWQFNLWRQGGKFCGYSQLDGNLLRFEFAGNANFALVGSRLTVSDASPFAPLIEAQPWLALRAEGLELQVEAPGVVAEMQGRKAMVI